MSDHHVYKKVELVGSSKTSIEDAINNAHDQILFINLGPSDGRGDRTIESLGIAYSPFDSSTTII